MPGGLSRRCDFWRWLNGWRLLGSCLRQCTLHRLWSIGSLLSSCGSLTLLAWRALSLCTHTAVRTLRPFALLAWRTWLPLSLCTPASVRTLRPFALLTWRTLPLLDAFAIASRRSEAADGTSLRASYLVRRPEVTKFAQELRRLQDRGDDMLLSCPGPWAPYSFGEAGR